MTTTSTSSTGNSGKGTIAVTGATGFVGRHIVRELLGRGYTVRALIREGSQAKAREAFGKGVSGIELVMGDVCDSAALGRLVKGAAACIHLVGIIREVRGGQGDSNTYPQTFERMHVQATRAVVDACRAAGVKRFLHMSALGVGPEGKAEYQKTKYEAERYVRRAFDDGAGGSGGASLDWTIFRPALIHGADGEFVKFMHDVCTGEVPPYFFLPYFARKQLDESVPAGRVDWIAPSVQPVAVEDVAIAFAAALERPESIGEIYNLVGPDVLKWPEMLEFFRDTLPGTNKALSPWYIPGEHAAIIALVAKTLGLGKLLPFDQGQAIMGAADATSETAKVQQQLGLKPRPFRETVRQYAGSMH